MSDFTKAIKIILSEPPEPHYPAYFANLLKEADVPDKDVGECSEIPNGSETIYRQDAIDALENIQIRGMKQDRDSCHLLVSLNEVNDVLEQLSFAQSEQCSDCIKHGGDWDCDHTRCRKGWVPSAQPEMQWIPVNKKLPKQGQEVICQCRANIIMVLQLDANGDWYQDARHCYMRGFVVAWMALPEPYRG